MTGRFVLEALLLLRVLVVVTTFTSNSGDSVGVVLEESLPSATVSMLAFFLLWTVNRFLDFSIDVVNAFLSLKFTY